MEQCPRFWEVRPARTVRDTWVGTRDVFRRTDIELAERIAAGDLPATAVPLFVRHRGEYRGDLLHATGECVVVASEAVCESLARTGATGWVTAPAAIRYRNGEELPGYRLLVTTGRCADFRIQRSADAPEARVDVSVGWDGSDVFWWQAPSRGFLVTDRVKRAIEDAGLQRIEFAIPTS